MMPLDRPVTRRWMMAALAAGVAAPRALADAPARSLRPPARRLATVSTRTVAAPSASALIGAAQLGGDVAFAVADAATGQVLESSGIGKALPPASVAKAVTALYALDRLGPDHRFATRVVATGPVSGGRIEGDLILLGGGDPVLDTDALADLAAAVVARGVRAITGRFLVSPGPLPRIETIDADQPLHVSYSPAVSGLNLNHNRVHFEWARAGGAWQVSMDARAARHRPRVYVTRMQIVDRGAPLYTHRVDGRFEDWTVMRGALGNGGSRWLPVRQPEVYAGDVFQTLARAQGLPLPNPVVAGRVPGGTVIASHQSPPLPAILRDMLRYSTNLTAEVVGLSASAAGASAPRDLSASGRAMSDWATAALGTGSARFVDHSGLGDASRISPGDMVRALSDPRARAALQGLLRPFDLRNAEGRAVRDHPVRVAAKTGTLNFVSGLGGYIATPGGADLVFAIFAADTARRAALSVTERERPSGGPQWVRRARILQSRLIERWAAVYGG